MSAVLEEVDRLKPEQVSGPRRIAGRDSKLPEWLVEEREVPERPRFDSAVIIGNGLAALSCAARLARSKAFSGKVVMMGKPPVPSRRLLAGLTLRARSLDYFSACLGISRASFLAELYQGHDREVAALEQRVARYEGTGSGPYTFGKRGLWMSRWNHKGRVVCYGVRNSHLVDTIYRLMDHLDVSWVDAKPASISDCRDIAKGRNPIVINATPMPLAGTGVVPAKPKNFVVASQMLFSNERQREKGILPPNTSFFTARRRAGRADASVWYPVWDPLSPTARFYGITYRIVKAGEGLYKEAEIDIQTSHLYGLSEALGLSPVDPGETLGTAMVPCSNWNDVHQHTPGYLHLGKLANLGTPIIAGDGMARAGNAAFVAAEAPLAGEEVQPMVSRAARGWAQRNRLTHHAFTSLSLFADLGLRVMPGTALNLIQDFGETWAGLE